MKRLLVACVLLALPLAAVAHDGPHFDAKRLAEESLKVEFTVTDNAQRLTVRYEGILPDLFREGQGVIAQGRLQEDKVFIADQVLTKHDENYMPPEVAKTLKPMPAVNEKK